MELENVYIYKNKGNRKTKNNINTERRRGRSKYFPFGRQENYLIFKIKKNYKTSIQRSRGAPPKELKTNN